MQGQLGYAVIGELNFRRPPNRQKLPDLSARKAKPSNGLVKSFCVDARHGNHSYHCENKLTSVSR